MHSLKLKLMLIITVAAALALGAVSYLNYGNASDILEEELSKAAAHSAEYNAKIVDQWLEGMMSEVQDIAENEAVKSGDPEKYIPFLKLILSKHEEFELLYASDQNGESAGTNDTIFNITDRDYFQQAMQTGKPVISDPIVSKATGNDIVVVVAPTFQADQTEPRGLVGVCVTLHYLQELVKDMKLNGYGYGLIQNTDMSTIAHPTDEWVGNKKIINAGDQRLTDLFERMSQGEKGYGAYTYQGTEKLMAYAPIKVTGWAIAQSANMADVMEPLGIIRNTSVLVTIIAIAIMLVIAILIANTVSKPMVKLSRAAEAIAHGDLTRKVEVGNRKDEIGALAGAFAEMVDSLKAMIISVQDSSAQVASHSQELASSSEEVSATVEEVASTTNEVAATSSQGAENAGSAAQESEQVQQVAEEGNKAVQETVEKIKSIANSSESVSTAINKLGTQSEQIGNIIDTITNIADQTNLLALNAAIEAARAGEHGKGFAVVAEEVRKLAEQSAEAANQITGLIKEIQVGVGEAINAMDHGASEVSEGVQVANNAGVALEQISKAIQKNTTVVKDLAAGIEQSNEGMQQLSSSNEQITSTVQQVSGAAQELANIAGELQNTIDRFKVDNYEIEAGNSGQVTDEYDKVNE